MVHSTRYCGTQRHAAGAMMHSQRGLAALNYFLEPKNDKPKLGTGVSCLGIGSGLSFGLEAAASALLGGIELDVAINNKDIALDLL